MGQGRRNFLFNKKHCIPSWELTHQLGHHSKGKSFQIPSDGDENIQRMTFVS